MTRTWQSGLRPTSNPPLGRRFAGRRPTTPDVPSYAVRDYGNRVAIWRMMGTFGRSGFRASVMLNAEVCLCEPQIIRAGSARGWEWLGHALTNGRAPGRSVI